MRLMEIAINQRIAKRAWRFALQPTAISLAIASTYCIYPAVVTAQTQYGQPAGNALDQPMQPGSAAQNNRLPRAEAQYGQPAGNALDQPMQMQGMPQYGQPAGSALDQPMAPPNQAPFGSPQAVPNNMPLQVQPGQFPQGQMSPDQVCPMDLTSATFGKLVIDMENAQFMSATVGAMHLGVLGLDMKNSSLKGLEIAVRSGQFKDVAFDQLSISAQGDMTFDRNELMNQRTIHFSPPIQAQVSAVVSQDSLNRFINAPGTLERLSGSASQKIRMLAGMLGSNANVGLHLSDASVQLEKGNRVNMGVKAQIGMGGVGVPLPLNVDTKLGLNDQGWIALSNTKLISNGQEISPMLSNMLVKHFNEMTDWGKRNDDMKFSFTELKVVPNKQFIVKGTAQVSRLRFGLP
jgi:hypothetical protein